MKLTITRRQEIDTDRRGRSQGATFQFHCRAELDAHEHELVERYRRGEYPLAQIDVRGRDPRDSVIELSKLLQGMTIESRFVSDAINAEEAIKEGCGEFKKWLLTEESYGGQEELEI